MQAAKIDVPSSNLSLSLSVVRLLLHYLQKHISRAIRADASAVRQGRKETHSINQGRNIYPSLV